MLHCPLHHVQGVGGQWRGTRHQVCSSFEIRNYIASHVHVVQIPVVESARSVKVNRVRQRRNLQFRIKQANAMWT